MYIIIIVIKVTSSRRSARVVAHVKITTWASLSVLRFSLNCSGPSMSIAVFENGGNPSFGYPQTWQLTHKLL